MWVNALTVNTLFLVSRPASGSSITAAVVFAAHQKRMGLWTIKTFFESLNFQKRNLTRLLSHLLPESCPHDLVRVGGDGRAHLGEGGGGEEVGGGESVRRGQAPHSSLLVLAMA